MSFMLIVYAIIMIFLVGCTPSLLALTADSSSNDTKNRSYFQPPHYSPIAYFTQLRSQDLHTLNVTVNNNTRINHMELQMIGQEQNQFDRIVRAIKLQGYSIRGFYHTSAWRKYWEEVITEQLFLMDGRRRFPVDLNDDTPSHSWHWDTSKVFTSLLNASDILYMNVAGEQASDLKRVKDLVQSLNLVHRNRIHFNFNATLDRRAWQKGNETVRHQLLRLDNVSSGEWATVNKLQDYCLKEVNNGRKAIVYYLHNKGGCCFRRKINDTNAVSAWREEMNAAVIEFPSICIRALQKGYSACGAENQNAMFAGNFWWADCQHVAQLPRMRNRFNAWAPENFILKPNALHNVNRRFGFQCGYSVYNCGINLYDRECRREYYRERLYSMMSGELGPNMVAVNVSDTQVCVEVKHKGQYNNQHDELNKKLLQEYEGLNSAAKVRATSTARIPSL